MNGKMIAILVLIVVMVGGVWFVTYSKRSPSLQMGSTQRTDDSLGTPAPSSVPTESTASGTSAGISLTITTPTDGAKVETSSITVAGKTSPYAEVFVNDDQTVADAKGNFSLKLAVDEGENPIVISVNDAEGHVAEKELMVTYEIDE